MTAAVRRLRQTAISNAFGTSSVSIRAPIDQPTIWRENKSMTAARYCRDVRRFMGARCLAGAPDLGMGYSHPGPGSAQMIVWQVSHVASDVGMRDPWGLRASAQEAAKALGSRSWRSVTDCAHVAHQCIGGTPIMPGLNAQAAPCAARLQYCPLKYSSGCAAAASCRFSAFTSPITIR